MLFITGIGINEDEAMKSTCKGYISYCPGMPTKT